MQLLRERDVPANTNDRVFQYSRARAVGACGMVLAGSGVLFAVGAHQHAIVLQLGALFVVAGVFLGRRFATARFRDSNWLVRANENGLYVHFRSYLNYHFSPDYFTVAFIPYREIRVARSFREQRELPEPSRSGRDVSVQTRHIVELELTGDTAALATALTEERARPAPREARWYGNTAVRYQHEPVALGEQGCLSLLWECVPRATDLLAVLAPHVSVHEEAPRSTSNRAVAALSRGEQEQRLAALARSGQIVAAITMARRLYAYDLKQARDFVESLRRGPITIAPPSTR
jgi:hypothetical protein